MKKTIKLCALLVAAATAIAVTFTGCPDLGFGKDDLFGTWMTLDFVNGEPVSYYTTTGTDAGTYSVTWKFDGKSENMFAGTGGIFKQHLVKYSNTSLSGTPSAETFWYGEYAIKANSSCSKGKLYLYYECGYDMKTGSATLDELWDWDRDDYIRNSGFGSIDDLTGDGDLREDPNTHVRFYQKQISSTPVAYNPVLIQIRKEGNDIKCSDIEYFRFNLKDGSLYGYTRLMATTRNARGGNTDLGGIYSQWSGESAIGDTTFRGGVRIHNGCSWKGDNVRYMGRISARGTPEEPVWMYSNTKSNSELFNLVDNDDDTNYTIPDADIDDKAEQ